MVEATTARHASVGDEKRGIHGHIGGADKEGEKEKNLTSTRVLTEKQREGLRVREVENDRREKQSREIAVAVKVRHPNVVERIRRDLYLLHYGARFIDMIGCQS